MYQEIVSFCSLQTIELKLLNVDAAVFQSDNRMAWGAIVRNHLGDIKLACQESIDEIQSPELAEAMAVR
jgi:hypothetical protein